MLFICYNCDKKFYKQHGKLVEADDIHGCKHCELWVDKYSFRKINKNKNDNSS